MAEGEPVPSFIAQLDQPLIGIIVRDGDRQVIHYFTDEAEAERSADPRGVRLARALAGAWSDLNWDDFETALDRIRHESYPTPPITEL